MDVVIVCFLSLYFFNIIYGSSSFPINIPLYIYTLKYPNKTFLPGTAQGLIKNLWIFHTFSKYNKDCLPYLFHGFRNKYFNNISLDNMLYFQNKLYKFYENAWFFDKYAMKNNLQNKM